MMAVIGIYIFFVIKELVIVGEQKLAIPEVYKPGVGPYLLTIIGLLVLLVFLVNLGYMVASIIMVSF